MVIALIICIPITALVVGFLVLKATQLGLRWQVQIKQEQQPTMQSPIAPIIEKMEQKQEAQAVQEQTNILNEWLHGAPEEKR